MILISFLIALLVGFDNGIGFQLSLSRTLVFLPFFLLGQYFKQINFDFVIFKKKHGIKIIGLSFVVLAYIFLSGKVDHAWFFGYSGYGSDYANLLQRVSAYIITLAMSSAVLAIIPTREIRFVSTLGRRTLSVYLLHGFFLILLGRFFPLETLTSKLSIVSYILISTIVIVILTSSKPVTFVFNKLSK